MYKLDETLLAVFSSILQARVWSYTLDKRFPTYFRTRVCKSPRVFALNYSELICSCRCCFFIVVVVTY